MPRTLAVTTEVSAKELAAHASEIEAYAKEIRETLAVMKKERQASVFVLAWKSALECSARAKAFRLRIAEAKYAIQAGSPQDAFTVAPRSRAEAGKVGK